MLVLQLHTFTCREQIILIIMQAQLTLSSPSSGSGVGERNSVGSSLYLIQGQLRGWTLPFSTMWKPVLPNTRQREREQERNTEAKKNKPTTNQPTKEKNKNKQKNIYDFPAGNLDSFMTIYWDWFQEIIVSSKLKLNMERTHGC